MSSTCQKQDLKTALTCFIHFSHYSTVMRTINILFSELKDEIFLEHESLANLVRKLPGALNLADECTCRLASQNGAASANITGKNKELFTYLPWEPALRPVHRSAHV